MKRPSLNILTAPFRAIASAWERRVDFKQLRREVHGLLPNLSGVNVTPWNALNFVSVYASINTIATDSACLPLSVYQTQPDGSRLLNVAHPAHDLVHFTPDGEATAMGFRQSLLAHTLGWGNGMAEIEFLKSGFPGALHLLAAQTVAARDKQNQLFYDDGRKSYPARKIIHVAGLGYDGLSGYSPIRMARQAIGLGIAVETFGSAFFGNGSTPNGILESPKTLKEDTVKELRKQFQELHGGPFNAGRAAILHSGLTWKQTTIAPEEAQFLATREFQRTEIAALYRLPPHKIGDYSQSHLANLEEANLDYLITTLMPWLIRVEQAMNLKLFTPDERRKGLHVEHDMSAFLRGNMSARADFYTKMFALGMSVNEIRSREGMNPIADKGGGNKNFVPLNMITLDKAGNEPVGDPNATKRDSSPVDGGDARIEPRDAA